AALPAPRIDAVLSKLRTAFPQAVPAPSILTTGLTNMNATLHVERLAVARALGAQVPGIHAWLLDTYGLGGDSLAETLHRLKHEPTGPYQWTPTPPSLQHKYVIEDVPCGLVPMSSLGRAAGVATPVIDGLIALTSAMLGRDFRAEGRNLDALGLAGKTVAEIRSIADAGPPA